MPFQNQTSFPIEQPPSDPECNPKPIPPINQPNTIRENLRTMPATNTFNSNTTKKPSVGERMYSSPPHRTPFSASDRTLHSASSDPEPLTQPKEGQAPAPTSLPPSFVERGEVLSADEMTTKFTDAEWEDIFAEVEGKVQEVLKKKEEEEEGEVRDEEIPGLVDHTLLREDATEGGIRGLCEEAKMEGFKAVCVRPNWTSLCSQLLQDTPVSVATVIAFPEGTQDLSTSLLELRSSLPTISEADIVLSRSHLLSKNFTTLYNDLISLRQQSPPSSNSITLKLILETSALSHFQILSASTLAAAAGFDYIKTSTGYFGHGATIPHVRLMAAACDVLAQKKWREKFGHAGRREKMLVKASGGIRTLEDARGTVSAGARRLGTSAGVRIAEEVREGKKGEERAGGEGY